MTTNGGEQPAKSPDRPVVVDFESVFRALRANDYGPFWVEFRLDGHGADPRGMLFEALENLVIPDDNSVSNLCPVRTPRELVLRITVDDAASFHEFFDLLTDALAQRGATGTIVGTHAADYPAIVDHLLDPEPIVYFVWRWPPGSTRKNTSTAHWGLTPDQVPEVCHHIATWLTAAGPHTVVSFGGYTFATSGSESLGTIMASSVRETDHTDAVCWDNDAPRARLMSYGPWSEVVAQMIDDTVPRRARAEGLRDLAVPLADAVNLAFIRPDIRGASSHSLGFWRHPLPNVAAGEVVHNKHVLDRYVPDACGIQLLTTAHIHRAHDLTNWNVTQVATDRYIVEAKDLDPWYDTTYPDPDTLQRARHDFGDMILTTKTIADNPPPR